MNSLSYSGKLHHPKWQKRRLEIITRDNLTCQLCSDKETQLHVHHKYYEPGKEPWEYPDHALTSICKHCHQCATILQEFGHDCLVSVKLGDKNLPEFVIILMVHKSFTGEVAVSQFTNPNASNKMELISTTTDPHIRKMNELLDLAKNLM